MTVLHKFGIAFGTLASLGSATYGGFVYFNSTNVKISSLINKEYSHILLKNGTNEDTEHWTKNWENYKTQNLNREKDLFQLKGWKKDGNADVTEELKKKCDSLKDSKVYGPSDEIYKKVTKYCARPVTVADQAEKEGLEIIKTESSPISNDWTEKNSNKAELKQHIEKLKITYASVNAEILKEGCKASKTKDKSLGIEYSSVYEAYKAVCTKPKTR